MPFLYPLTVALASAAFAQQQKPIGEGFRTEEHTQGYKFDPLLHLPGISPYFDVQYSFMWSELPLTVRC